MTASVPHEPCAFCGTTPPRLAPAGWRVVDVTLAGGPFTVTICPRCTGLAHLIAPSLVGSGR